MKKYLSRILLAVCFFAGMVCGASASEKQPLHHLQWQEGPALLVGDKDIDLGLARPFYGENKGMILISGGANFPRQDRPKKIYSEIIACDVQGFSEKSQWKMVGHLPQPIAEGGSVTTSKGVFCVGGVNKDGKDLSDTFLMVWNEQKKTVEIVSLPKLPVTVHMPAIAVWNDVVYVIAGRQNGKMSNDVWRFDLKMWLEWKTLTSQPQAVKKTKDIILEKLYLKKEVVAGTEPQWEALPPLPGLARAQAIAAIQNTDQKKVALYVFGGFGIDDKNHNIALEDGYAYDIEQQNLGTWQEVASLNNPQKGYDFSTIGASAVVSGNQHILVFGGFNPKIWNQVCAETKKKTGDALSQYLQEYFSQSPEQFDWNKKVMAYHTVTNSWTCLNEVPFLPRCGACTIKLSNGKMIIVGGEIKPKERTPNCQIGTFVRSESFSWINWSVIAIYFLGITLMGFWFMRRNKNADDYFKGGGKIPWWAVGMSIFATMLSSITFLSIPTMTYISDWRYFPMVLCIFFMAPVVIYYYLPFFRGLNITSAYEYLEKRFNLSSRLFASLAFNIFMICRVAVVTLLPSLAMSAVTGMDVKLCIVIIGIITILYCAFGGIEAVIWSDFIQGIILVGGAFGVLVLLICDTDGGMGGFISQANSANKFTMWDFRFLVPQPVFWVVMVQGIVGNLASYTSDQCVVQRYVTTKDEKEAARSIWFNGVMSVFASILFYLLGTALYTHYKSFPMLLDVTMPKADSIFPIYMVSELPVGACGLLIAAIFAATMSTLSSNLNSSATSITCDFVVRFKKDITSKHQMLLGQIFTLLIGILGTVAALILADMESRSLFDQFQKFIAMLTGGLACLFFMGIFTTRINGRGALVGLIANYVVCYWLDLSVLPNKPHAFVYGGIGMVVCFVVAYFFSLIFPQEQTLSGLTIFSRKKKAE